MKKRDISLDYIRIISMFFIVLFHAALQLGTSSNWFLAYKNATYGDLGNVLFFMLSGYLLRAIYPKVTELKNFYIKRWTAIFPAFYIAFLVVYLFNVIRQGDFFYLGHPASLLFTLFGIDNYVNWFGLPNYALVGEWFTGVIVVLYLCYPILSKLMNRLKWTTTAVLTVMYILNLLLHWYPVEAGISLISCLYFFWSGMLLFELKDTFREFKFTPVITVPIVLLIFFVSFAPVEQTILNHILCTCLFITFLCIFKDVDNNSKFSKCIIWLSGLTYYIYLTHHYIVNVFGRRTDIFGVVPKPLLILLYIIVVFVSSIGLKAVTEIVLKKRKKKLS